MNPQFSAAKGRSPNHWTSRVFPTCAVLPFQSCPTLRDPMDCGPPGSSVHGILQARILEWVALHSSRESSRPRDRICISKDPCIGRQALYHECHLKYNVHPEKWVSSLLDEFSQMDHTHLTSTQIEKPTTTRLPTSSQLPPPQLTPRSSKADHPLTSYNKEWF